METIRALLLRDKAVKAAVEKGLIKTTTSVLSTPPHNMDDQEWSEKTPQEIM